MELLKRHSHRERKTTWAYEAQLRNYLLLVAQKGLQALEPLSAFPHNIELSRDWHVFLDTMRSQTEGDGKERWALAGVKEDKTALFLPKTFALGEARHVPSDVIKRSKQQARDVYGIVGIVGDIHSHPRSPTTQEMLLELLERFNTQQLKAFFSPEDYFSILKPRANIAFMGVVDGPYNLFAFPTRDTQDTKINPLLFDQYAFAGYWKREIPDPEEMNLAIAKRHAIALYQGRTGENLTRIVTK